MRPIDRNKMDAAHCHISQRRDFPGHESPWTHSTQSGWIPVIELYSPVHNMPERKGEESLMSTLLDGLAVRWGRLTPRR